MKLSQSVLFWCMLAAFVLCVISATLPPSSDGVNKLNAVLQKMDLCAHNRSSEDSVENRDTGSAMSQNSDQPSGRMKRGCNLLTCSVHDLAYRINRLKTNKAPAQKISPCGYGRRRRRSPLQSSSAPAHREDHIFTLQAQRRNLPQKMT